MLGWVYAGLDNRMHTFAALEKACEQRDPTMPEIAVCVLDAQFPSRRSALPQPAEADEAGYELFGVPDAPVTPALEGVRCFAQSSGSAGVSCEDPDFAWY
jgi:hypothetical protein